MPNGRRKKKPSRRRGGGGRKELTHQSRGKHRGGGADDEGQKRRVQGQVTQKGSGQLVRGFRGVTKGEVRKQNRRHDRSPGNDNSGQRVYTGSPSLNCLELDQEKIKTEETFGSSLRSGGGGGGGGRGWGRCKRL